MWKTRGNAAVCLEIFGGTPEVILTSACKLIETFAEFDCEKTNPGIVVVDEQPDPAFYYQAMQKFCTIEETIQRLERIGAYYRGYKCGRGLIGALAAVSSILPDATYELLAYRSPERFGTPRQITGESFFTSASATYPHTWDTVDPAAGTIVCVPHGKDPVLYGIRGESSEWVEHSVAQLQSESPALSQIWRTNQGTDAHLLICDDEPKDGLSYYMNGLVTAAPTTRRGGHVSFVFRLDVRGKEIVAFAFEPTKGFRHAVRKLLPGDQVTLCGSWRGGVLHLEKFRLNTLAIAEIRKSPKCPICGGRMTSAGCSKGYKCRSCSGRTREIATMPREITEGWYEVPPGARRHLTKPIARIQER
jgi:tRNA(Ile2)-agmatinylcytidine synthase